MQISDRAARWWKASFAFDPPRLRAGFASSMLRFWPVLQCHASTRPMLRFGFPFSALRCFSYVDQVIIAADMRHKSRQPRLCLDAGPEVGGLELPQVNEYSIDVFLLKLKAASHPHVERDTRQYRRSPKKGDFAGIHNCFRVREGTDAAISAAPRGARSSPRRSGRACLSRGREFRALVSSRQSSEHMQPAALSRVRRLQTTRVPAIHQPQARAEAPRKEGFLNASHREHRLKPANPSAIREQLLLAGPSLSVHRAPEAFS